MVNCILILFIQLLRKKKSNNVLEVYYNYYVEL